MQILLVLLLLLLLLPLLLLLLLLATPLIVVLGLQELDVAHHTAVVRDNGFFEPRRASHPKVHEETAEVDGDVRLCCWTRVEEQISRQWRLGSEGLPAAPEALDLWRANGDRTRRPQVLNTTNVHSDSRGTTSVSCGCQ